MQEFITTVLFPGLIGLFTAAVTWFLARRKNTAEAKSAEIDNEIKSALFGIDKEFKSATVYQSILDDMSRRLEESIAAIEKRDARIKERDARIEERDERIEHLMNVVENITTELRKYKQLNGKTE